LADTARLKAAKLSALVRSHIDEELIIDEAPGYPGGLVPSGGAWVLASGDDPIRALGPALLWSTKRGADTLDLITDVDARDLARRAVAFGERVRVWRTSGTRLEAVEPTPVSPAPTLADDEWAMAGLIADAGARPVDDHGRLVAEVAGLEVARVSRSADGGVQLDVGVGQADRELHGLVHTELDADTALRRAITAVLAHRRPGASPHPLNRMARERWLRSELLDTPALIGGAALDPLPPLRPRQTVLGNVPIAAVGVSAESGSTIVVVCSVGVDPDLVPEASDYRLRTSPEAELVIVVPDRDRHLLTETLVRQLPKARLQAARAPWEG
jgi:hypothetical protein